MNTARCTGVGTALGLTPDEFSADAVAASAERLIAEPGFEVAAGSIRAEIDAMPSSADVLAVLSIQEAAVSYSLSRARLFDEPPGRGAGVTGPGRRPRPGRCAAAGCTPGTPAGWTLTATCTSLTESKT